MFGLNDADTKTDDNSDKGQIPSPPLMQSNPFADAPASGSAAAPPASDTNSQPAATPPTQNPDDLLDLKEQALTSLQPLVSHLDQTPEEKFKTTMMLIQATDNSALVKDAYQAAKQITDEKARAQALLDVVNEINYFTQRNDEDKPQSV